MDAVIFELLFLVLLIVTNGLFAMSEIAVVSARKVRLQQRADAGDRGALVALRLANTPTPFLSTIQIGITLIGILTGAFGGTTLAEELAAGLNRIQWLAPYSEVVGIGVVVVGMTYLSLVIGELVPKRLALNQAEQIAAAVAPLLQALSRAASPVVRLLTLSTELILRILGIRPSSETPVTEEEIKLMIEQGTQVGVFAPAEQELVKQVFRLTDRTVGALLVPRPEVVWLDLNDSPEEIRRKVTASGHAQFPVARGDLDNVLGLVYTKDLLAQIMNDQPLSLKAALRPALFVPESMSVLEVLERLKETYSQVVLVIDEYGGFQGLMTVHDILEAIVGDIPLPEEATEAEVVRREDGSWLMDGRLLVDELREVVRLEKLPYEGEGHYQTLGGLVMTCLGRIPSTGDHFEWEGLRFEVVDMDGRRIDKVLVTPLRPMP